MSNKESTLERECKRLARLFGWVAFKGSSRSGGADQVFLSKGRGFCVEFKVKGNEQQSNQVNEEKIMEDHGIPYYVVYTHDDFVKALKEQTCK